MNCHFFKYLATSVFIRGLAIVDSFNFLCRNRAQKKTHGVDGQGVDVLQRNRASPSGDLDPSSLCLLGLELPSG